MNRKVLRTLAIAGAAAALGAVTVYARGVNYYNEHYLPDTVINDTDYSSKVPQDVLSDLEAQTASRSLELVLRDGSSVQIPAQDVGLACSDGGAAQRILAEQNAASWPLQYLPGDGTGEVIPMTYTYDSGRLQAFLESVPAFQAENMTPPTDASVVYSEEENKFVVDPGEEGDTLDPAVLLEAVGASLTDGDTSLELDAVDGLYETAAVRADDPSLQAEADNLNDLIRGSITYLLPHGKKRVFNGETCKSWLGVKEDGTYYYDEAKWDENLLRAADEMEADTDTVWKEKHFHATIKGDITVPGGTYGYGLDKISEIEALRAMRTSGEYVTREPAYNTVEVDTEINDGIGDTYIEVDVDNQYMWYYKDGKVVMECYVVTGTMDGKHNTPLGIWQIQGKEANATLIGEKKKNGKPEYKTKVSYWMPFYDGCGFHDAWWRGYFGGTIYQYSGSHGCVNMPVSSAGELFDAVDTGTIVVIY